MQIEVNEERIQEVVGTIKRRNGGLTNEQMAQRLGFDTAKTLASRIRGDSDWRLGEITELCNLYGCEPNELFKGGRMTERMWLTPKEVADAYQLSYHEALALAKSGEVAGYWRGNRFRFNAWKTQEAFEDGTFERVLSTRA